MQNLPCKFHLDSFKFFNFIFIQLSLLKSFKFVQLRSSSTSVKCLLLKCPILIFFNKKKIKNIFLKKNRFGFPNRHDEETSVTQTKKYTSSLPSLATFLFYLHLFLSLTLYSNLSFQPYCYPQKLGQGVSDQPTLNFLFSYASLSLSLSIGI